MTEDKNKQDSDLTKQIQELHHYKESWKKKKEKIQLQVENFNVQLTNKQQSCNDLKLQSLREVERSKKTLQKANAKDEQNDQETATLKQQLQEVQEKLTAQESNLTNSTQRQDESVSK
jgi:hypothetical protein